MDPVIGQAIIDETVHRFSDAESRQWKELHDLLKAGCPGKNGRRRARKLEGRMRRVFSRHLAELKKEWTESNDNRALSAEAPLFQSAGGDV